MQGMGMETGTIEEIIGGIRGRGILLRVDNGKIIAENGRLTSGERKALRANRAAAIAYLASSQSAATPVPEPESPEVAYARGHAEGYALGIEHATAEFQAKTQTVADK